MARNWLTLTLLFAAALALAGCRNGPCRRRLIDRDPPPRGNPDALGDPIPPRTVPLEPIPSPGVPPTPGRSYYPDPRESQYPPPYSQRNLLPGPAPGVLGEPILPATPAPRPAEVPLEVPTQPKILTPVPLPTDPPKQVDAPRQPEAAKLPPAPTPKTDRTDLPPAVEKPAAARSPAELPGFADVPLSRGQVTTSLKPVPDGFAWLKLNGYKTVLYLHEPGAADVGSARELAEKQGLKFVPVAATPETLPAAYAAFAAVLRDAAARPLHVFAKSGNRSGALWYLAFRKLELLDADQARVRAGKLGLDAPDTSDEAKQFWLAATEFLSK